MTSTDPLTYVRSTPCFQLPINAYLRYLRSKIIIFLYKDHFNINNNNKQLLHQNQIKTIQNLINETTNKQLPVQSQKQKCKNKVQKTVRAYNKDTRATNDVILVCLLSSPNVTPNPALAPPLSISIKQLISRKKTVPSEQLNSRTYILKLMLNESVRIMINEHL